MNVCVISFSGHDSAEQQESFYSSLVLGLMHGATVPPADHRRVLFLL